MTLADVVARVREALAASAGGPRRPAVVAHDIWLASGLETVLPETVLMCVQRSSAIDVLRDRGIEVFCLSEHVPAVGVEGKSSADRLIADWNRARPELDVNLHRRVPPGVEDLPGPHGGDLAAHSSSFARSK